MISVYFLFSDVLRNTVHLHYPTINRRVVDPKIFFYADPDPNKKDSENRPDPDPTLTFSKTPFFEIFGSQSF